MDQTPTNRTLLFADVCNSTHLYETLGNEGARRKIAELLDRAAAEVTGHGGRVIKSIGDEIMCDFPRTGAGRARQPSHPGTGRGIPDPTLPDPGGLHLRIGLQEGPVLEENGDVFGDAVNVAARMTDLAKGGQILTTEDTFSKLPQDLQTGARHLDNIQVKGKRDPVKVYEIIVEPEDATRLMSGLFELAPSAQSLTVRWAGSEWVLGPKATELQMGRGHQTAEVVEDSRVSREHASIHLRRDKLILCDRSANGTYVEIQGETHYLRREEIELHHSGRISMGRPFDDPLYRHRFRLRRGLAPPARSPGQR